MKEDLTSQVLAYKNGQLDQDALIRAIAIYLYTFLQHRYQPDEDTASELFCCIYRRIPRLIECFHYRGQPFGIYFHMSIKRISINFFQTRHRRRALKRYSESIYCEDHLVSLPQELPEEKIPVMDERARNYFAIDERRRLTSPHLKRRILCLICKSAYHASPDQIRRTAQLAGVSAVWLEARISSLRRTMSARVNRFESLSTQRKEYMARARVYHEQLSTATGEEQEIYRRRYTSATKRVRDLSRAIQRVPLAPTHGAIARELNIPKGSVDSGLHYLKSALSRNLNNKKSKEQEG